MLLPIGDDNRDRQLFPIVNYFFILANIIIFIFLQNWGHNLHFTYAYSVVPAEILSGHDIITHSKILIDPFTGERIPMPPLQPTNIPVYLTLITSLFLHGGIAHIAGNMLFLWIFGDNIEDAMGHGRYFFFYLLCGVLAGLAHVFSTYFLNQNLFIPSLGASGAIAGVLGGYLILFPGKRIYIWLFFFFIIAVPAFLVVGLWFIFQVINSWGMLGGNEAGSIAYAAHIGGFIAGLVLIKKFVQRKHSLIHKRKSFW